MVLILLLIVT